jgi:hypothetical protein
MHSDSCVRLGLLAAQLIKPFLDSSGTPTYALAIIMIVPPFAFFRGLYGLSSSVGSNGMGVRMNEIANADVALDQVCRDTRMECAARR